MGQFCCAASHFENLIDAVQHRAPARGADLLHPRAKVGGPGGIARGDRLDVVDHVGNGVAREGRPHQLGRQRCGAVQRGEDGGIESGQGVRAAQRPQHQRSTTHPVITIRGQPGPAPHRVSQPGNEPYVRPCLGHGGSNDLGRSERSDGGNVVAAQANSTLANTCRGTSQRPDSCGHGETHRQPPRPRGHDRQQPRGLAVTVNKQVQRLGVAGHDARLAHRPREQPGAQHGHCGGQSHDSEPTQPAIVHLMVKVANDSAPLPQDLPSAGSTLELVCALALAAEATHHTTAAQRAMRVESFTPIADAVHPGWVGGSHLVVGSLASAIEHLEGSAGSLATLRAAGAVGLVVVTPLKPGRSRKSSLGLPGLVEACAAADLALIVVPEDRVQQFTIDALRAVLDAQTSTLRRLEGAERALVQIVLTGGSLDEVCQQVVDFLGGAAIVATTDGRVMSSAGTKTAISEALDLPCFDRTGRLLTETEPIGVRTGSGPESHRALVRIGATPLDHGVLAAFTDAPIPADDVRVLERAATVAALTIAKDQAVSAVESKYRAEFLRDALAGRAGPPAAALSHAASLGWDIARPVVVVVAETDEDDENTHRDEDEVRFLQDRFARAWTHAMAVRDTRAPVMGFSREVVALFPVGSDHDSERIMRAVGEVAKVVRGDGGGGRRTFSTGVSRVASSATELPRAYEEALSAVAVGRQMHGEGALTHFDGLGIFRLLALIPDSAQLRRFVEESLGELATDDSAENADLRQTLSLLIDTNMNVAETARQLFFHYNTLRYRIAKLEKMLGPFSTDANLRLTLALALKVHQMKGL